VSPAPPTSTACYHTALYLLSASVSGRTHALSFLLLFTYRVFFCIRLTRNYTTIICLFLDRYPIIIICRSACDRAYIIILVLTLDRKALCFELQNV